MSAKGIRFLNMQDILAFKELFLPRNGAQLALLWKAGVSLLAQSFFTPSFLPTGHSP
jgi:hypothetical protein